MEAFLMQELADKVWANGEFHAAADRLQRAWIAVEIDAPHIKIPPLAEAAKVIRAAAILACSSRLDHREKAYRSATSVFEMYGAKILPFDQATRVVLGRLGNFPAMLTRPPIKSALAEMPLSLIAEEVSVSEQRTITLRNQSFVLTNFQQRLWTRLRQRRRLALAAPTSAGKSFILQNFLASLFEGFSSRKIVYLVPTRALIAQVSQDLRRIFATGGSIAFAPVEIATVPFDGETRPPDRVVYVMTQERMQLTLNSYPDLSADVIVVDEAHSIADGSRGVLLQWVIEDLIKRSPNAQLLFASPGIGNLDLFGRLFGLNDIESLPSRELTVAQNFLTVTIHETRKGLATVRLVERNKEPFPIAEVNFQRRSINRIEKLANVAAHFGKGASNIIYANGAADAESVALELAQRFRDRESSTRREALATLVAESVHSSYALVECVRRGVGYHYSNMPTQVRQAVEAAVVSGDIDYLVCTSTLLQGVNLPAKNIFMFKPEKGQSSPLESVDFWNLAGRAGRLLREFQGNIFLIDYERWESRPLGQPREAQVISALETCVVRKRKQLIELMQQPSASNDDLEAVFVRLLDNLSEGTLPNALNRICDGHAVPLDEIQGLVDNLMTAARQISLPQVIIRRSPNISAHKQQALYLRLHGRAKASRGAALALLPRHPRDTDAYDSYKDILQLCLSVISGHKPTSGYHRFLALVALWWMRGHPLPRIVQNQLNRRKDRSPRQVVRDTLELIEREVRYNCVRLFACYSSVLSQVYHDLGMTDALSRMPAISLFLEIGASDRTMISLMSLGLSRVAALRLSAIAPNRNFDLSGTLDWLRSGNLENAELSPLLLEEVRLLLQSLTNVISIR
jgi:superfamily II DNA or RNA helicase